MRALWSARLALTVVGIAIVLIGACGAADERPATESAQSSGTHLSIATFNVHYISPRQERMRWEDRRGAVLAAVEELSADVVAFQEMETFEGGAFNRRNRQLEYLAVNLPQYSIGATGDPADYPSTQPIFFRSSRFALLDQGYFFFSDTPDRIYSRP